MEQEMAPAEQQLQRRKVKHDENQAAASMQTCLSML